MSHNDKDIVENVFTLFDKIQSELEVPLKARNLPLLPDEEVIQKLPSSQQERFVKEVSLCTHRIVTLLAKITQKNLRKDIFLKDLLVNKNISIPKAYIELGLWRYVEQLNRTFRNRLNRLLNKLSKLQPNEIENAVDQQSANSLDKMEVSSPVDKTGTPTSTVTPTSVITEKTQHTTSLKQSEMAKALSQLPTLNAEFFGEEPPLCEENSCEPKELTESSDESVASWNEDEESDESEETDGKNKDENNNDNFYENGYNNNNNNNNNNNKEKDNVSNRKCREETPKQLQKENMTSEELTKAFRDFYVVEMTDSYANELNELRQEDGFDARKVTLIIDCLEHGIEIFSDLEKQLMMKK